jgi:hypothetical protein
MWTRIARSRVALLESVASSPYRDVLAAGVAAAGSVALVKSLEALRLTGLVDRVRVVSEFVLPDLVHDVSHPLDMSKPCEQLSSVH